MRSPCAGAPVSTHQANSISRTRSGHSAFTCREYGKLRSADSHPTMPQSGSATVSASVTQILTAARPFSDQNVAVPERSGRMARFPTIFPEKAPSLDTAFDITERSES